MTAETAEDRVRNICSDHLGVAPESVVKDAKFEEDLQADSLDRVELVMAFEEEFGIDIADDDAEKLLTVGDAIEYLEKRIG